MLFMLRRSRGSAGQSLVLGMLVTLAMLTFVASARAVSIGTGEGYASVGGGGGSATSGFVIGDQNAAVGTSVTFWGSKWWKLNSLSGGSAPAAFKGYANTLSGPLVCGGTWSTGPGNSSGPPASPLPGLIEVIVSSEITKSGPTISGDIHGVVLVQPEPGYAPDPGHTGTGTVVGVVC
jgi:hypothetical protein